MNSFCKMLSLQNQFCVIHLTHNSTMRIVIVGAGAVGTYLAKYLSGEQMDIFIIDKDADKLTMLDSEYNLMTVEGDGLEFSTLRRAEVQRCDLVVAVTDATESNIVICGIAKSMGAKLTVARVDRQDYIEPENLKVLRAMGVDNAIFPEYLLGKGIIEALKHPWTRNWYEFNGGKMILAGLRIAENAPIAGKYLRDLSVGERFFHVVAIRRHFRTLIPDGNSRLLPNDILYVTTTASNQERLAQIAGKRLFNIKNVLIAGSGRTVEMTLNMASKMFKFTVIDENVERVQKLANLYPDCDAIIGDVSEPTALEEAGVESADAFVSLSKISESNILSCLVAKDMGIRKTVARIEHPYFLNMGESFHIGTIINKQMLMANTICQLLIDSGSVSSKCLILPDADMLRLEIKAGTKITSVPVKDLKIPKTITFAGVLRDGHSELVTGNTVLKEGDNVLVVCLSGGIHEARQLFE